MPVWLVGVLKSSVGVVGKMAASFVTEKVVKSLVMSVIDYYISHYEDKVSKTEDKMDDLRAEKLREIYNVVSENWKD